MSTSSKVATTKAASETALPTEKITAARSTTSQRTTRSLRERVLTKSMTRKTSKVRAPKPEAQEKCESVEERLIDSDEDPTELSACDTAAAGVSSTREVELLQTPEVEISAEERVAAWAQAETPRPIDDSDDDSASTYTGSETSETRSVTGRQSFILTTCRRRAGVEMDMANKLANEMLQNGKDALEQAGNMKKECKAIALESLQTMYETVLALSDSRSRHKSNLEKERTRHAQELVRVERAHNKQLAITRTSLTNKLNIASADIENTLKETRTIRDWLNFETREPHAQISELSRAMARLEKTAKELTESVSLATGSRTSEAEKTLLTESRKLSVGIENISRQLDTLRRDTTELSAHSTQAQTTSARAVELLEQRPQVPQTEAEEQRATHLEHEMAGIRTDIRDLKREILKGLVAPPPLNVPTPTKTTEMAEHLQPIAERLEAVSSELRTMREFRNRTPPPARSIEAEFAQLEEARAKPKPKTQTYAQIAATAPTPRPNHTLIVSSTDPKKTGENIIESIRQALDTKSGARVDRVRKARNQKVVLSCGTKEDLALVQNQVGANKGLKVEVAKTSNPLIRIKDVLAYHKDEEIVNQLRAQNKEIFVGIEKKDDVLRVRYRKRARNALECHPVLELSPVLYRKIIEAGVVYIGLQRRPVVDQTPLVQCARCLAYGHTKTVCREKADLCSYCGEAHSWEKCRQRQEDSPPCCKNCIRAQTTTPKTHTAYSDDCPERQKWDAIARSRVSYC